VTTTPTDTRSATRSAPDRETPLLEVEDLHVTFRTRRGGARAVDGVSIDVRPGEVLAIVGESGCGKTTLARAIIGLQTPTSGAIRFQGKPLPTTHAGRKAYRRAVQLVFQDPTGALDPRQTIYEAVAEGLRIHRIRDDEVGRVTRAVSQAGLRPPERFLQLRPHEVSGGQRQRVVIAGAMVLEPRLLVADEPVSSLDASVRGEILQLMLKLVQDTGIAIVVITHDLGLAWNIADRVAVMYLGRIVALGPTEEILTNPLHPYAKALLSVVPETEHMEPQLLVGEAPDPARVPAGCRFHPRCPVVASGEAESLGILGRCTGEDPQQLLAGPQYLVACHAATDGSQPAVHHADHGAGEHRPDRVGSPAQEGTESGDGDDAGEHVADGGTAEVDRDPGHEPEGGDGDAVEGASQPG
jgi:peptide/nickel transport system ATP-binding protein